ncbi:MAG: Nif3-like dinuclear metal center hexameric protein [Bacillota bacterium]
MELKKLTAALEKAFPYDAGKTPEPLCFIFPAVNQEAAIPVKKYYLSSFLTSCNGLMMQGEDRVQKVYCAVFPDDDVLRLILKDPEPGIFVFFHHCCAYDPVAGFRAIPAPLLEALAARRISLYSLHMPFDFNSPWSTSVKLAEALGIEIEGEFARIADRATGVYGRPPVRTVSAFASLVRKVTGSPDVVMILNGADTVRRVGVIAGGGGYANLVNDAAENHCDLYFTGVVAEQVELEPVQEANRFFREKAARLGINLVGGGHYHTEMVAVKGMTAFFRDLGLPAEFIPGGKHQK